MLTINVHWSLLLTLSQDGWTPLHAACQEGHVQVAELLLQAGASVEQETEVRWSVGQDCAGDTEQCTYTQVPPPNPTTSPIDSLFLGHSQILSHSCGQNLSFLHGCEIKSGGLGIRLHLTMIHAGVRLQYVSWLVVWYSWPLIYLAPTYMYRMAREHCILQVGMAMTRLWSFSSREKLMWTVRRRWGFSC